MRSCIKFAIAIRTVLFFCSLIILFSACGQERSEHTVAGSIPGAVLHVPVQVITSGPEHHWFGYYDKLAFDPTGRYVLSAQVDFEGRSPKQDDTIRVGMIDLQANNAWTASRFSWTSVRFMKANDLT